MIKFSLGNARLIRQREIQRIESIVNNAINRNQFAKYSNVYQLGRYKVDSCRVSMGSNNKCYIVS